MKYSITPLVWESTSTYHMQLFKAKTFSEVYFVQRRRDEETGKWNTWFWGLSSGVAACKTSANGKKKCEQHWINQITQALTEES